LPFPASFAAGGCSAALAGSLNKTMLTETKIFFVIPANNDMDFQFAK